MAILDDRDTWLAEFRAGWLKTYEDSGELDWKGYNLPRNRTDVAGPGIALDRARLVVVSSGGFYVPGEQEPFDEPDALGRYDIRRLPTATPAEQFAIAHTHYDHTAANADRQVLLPVGHLEKMVEEGSLGELAPEIISFMGYQPDATRVADETAPAVVAAATELQATAALLIPA